MYSFNKYILIYEMKKQNYKNSRKNIENLYDIDLGYEFSDLKIIHEYNW